jgi:predicted DNA binding CopG/RHH family protein
VFLDPRLLVLADESHSRIEKRYHAYGQSADGRLLLVSEAEERKFWETHDTADYSDLNKAQRARFPNLKLSTTAISLRLPQGTLDRIKIAANKRDVPYR